MTGGVLATIGWPKVTRSRAAIPGAAHSGRPCLAILGRGLAVLGLAAALSLAVSAASAGERPTADGQPVAERVAANEAPPIGGCDDIARRAEERFGIPRSLLRAIARVESARRVGEVVVAWAYTLNIAGAAHYADSVEEAAGKVLDAVGSGQSVDVGCMQVNLRWHKIAELEPDADAPAFRTVREALDPALNVAYGARFLRRLYEAEGDWTNAVARYHGASYERRRAYVCRVAVEHARLEGIELAGPPLGCEPPLDQRIPASGKVT